MLAIKCIVAPILEYVGYHVYYGSHFGIFWLSCLFWLQFWSILAISIVSTNGWVTAGQQGINAQVPLGNLAVVHFRILFFNTLPRTDVQNKIIYKRSC
jgi:hypothetical protein